MPDLSRTGAVSDAESERQIADVTGVYAGKSETPRVDAFIATQKRAYYAHAFSKPFFELAEHARALEKETARLRECLTKLHADGKRYMASENLLNPDRARWSVACRRISEALSPATTERADK